MSSFQRPNYIKIFAKNSAKLFQEVPLSIFWIKIELPNKYLCHGLSYFVGNALCGTKKAPKNIGKRQSYIAPSSCNSRKDIVNNK